MFYLYVVWVGRLIQLYKKKNYYYICAKELCALNIASGSFENARLERQMDMTIINMMSIKYTTLATRDYSCLGFRYD